MRYTHLLLAEPRALRKLRNPPVVFTAHGFQAVRLKGDEGDYFDVMMPEGAVETMPFFSLFESGGIECINEADGLWYAADADHPYSVRMLPDGRVLSDKPHRARSHGRTRMFLRDNTSRLCIYPVNVFEQTSLEPIVFEHLKGPLTLTLDKGRVFFLSRGEASFDDEKIGALAVRGELENDVTVVMAAGSYGAVAWKL